MALVVMNQDMDVVAASRAAFSMFGLRFHPQEEEKSVQALAEWLFANADLVSLIGAATMKLRMLGSSDRFTWENGERHYNAVVFTMPPADAIRFGVYFRDITDQLAFEQSRESARRYLEAILDNLPVGIVVMDREMHITNINRGEQLFLKAMGTQFSLLQVIGANAAELYPDEEDMKWDEIRAAVLEAGKGQAWLGPRKRYPLQDGKEIVLSITVAPLLNEKEETIGFIRVSEDVTEETRLTDELREAEMRTARLEGVQQVAVTLNHEINNALTTIIGNAQLIGALGEPLPENKQIMLNVLLDQAQRIAEVTQKLSAMKAMKSVEYLEGRGEAMVDTETE